MTRRNHAGWLTVLLAAVLAVAGCSKAGSAGEGRSFDSAMPTIKEVWNKAVAADQANDYVTAVALYRQLMVNPQLTTGQEQVVKEAAAKLSVRMWKAAHKGDRKAQEALAEQQKLNILPPRTK